MNLHKTQLLLILFILLAASGCGASQASPNSQIKGQVFFDNNENSSCDLAEAGYADIRIRLYEGSCSGQLLETAYSDQEGRFEFTNLPAGDYCVFPDIKPSCGGIAGNDATAGISRLVTLDEDETLVLEGFGYTPTLQNE